jgi:hypothetical protein
VLRTVVGLFNLRNGLTFHGKQRGSQGDQHVYFALDAIRGLRQCLE